MIRWLSRTGSLMESGRDDVFILHKKPYSSSSPSSSSILFNHPLFRKFMTTQPTTTGIKGKKETYIQTYIHTYLLTYLLTYINRSMEGRVMQPRTALAWK
ncbi:hypothetical protein TWF225_012093 [Orbilia oligospora]|nr:hypothetical protein TWF225_012093 [Orbilia oligospora]KAF3233304.1 hypothetical protein TWF128_012080 [Orbilia oligospora]KAF3237915.1 hypothetical protein TWF217_012074 [Orbilia oligospora]